jgi:hypothetical protein
MRIMVAGPHRTGGADAVKNPRFLRYSMQRRWRFTGSDKSPVIGVNLALPLIVLAGDNDAVYEEMMMPLSLALADRCDAYLRVGGRSKGADNEVREFEFSGRPIFRSLDEVPRAEPP